VGNERIKGGGSLRGEVSGSGGGGRRIRAGPMEKEQFGTKRSRCGGKGTKDWKAEEVLEKTPSTKRSRSRRIAIIIETELVTIRH